MQLNKTVYNCPSSLQLTPVRWGVYLADSLKKCFSAHNKDVFLAILTPFINFESV